MNHHNDNHYNPSVWQDMLGILIFAGAIWIILNVL